MVRVFFLAFLACEAHGNGASGLWAESELVWPQNPIGEKWQAYTLIRGGTIGTPSWPVALSEICREFDPDTNEVSDAAFHYNGMKSLLTEECHAKEDPRVFSLTLDLGAYPVDRRYPQSVPFESFHFGWGSSQVDPENGNAWVQIPPVVNTELRYPVSPHSFLYFRLGLRRDFTAWHQDPIGSNLPLSEKEVDLNEPSLGYFHAENAVFAFTLGRFPVHWSPSPDFGLALSSAVPYHNAAEFALKMPHVRYRFLVSSLNSWLEGTPAGDSSSEDYPVGSEQYRQRHYVSDHGAGIFHNRVYAENIKTLFAHRLEGSLGPAGVGITETQIIGGKVPDLRDAGPFVVFHNDFKDGYTNSALSLDGVLRLPVGFSLVAELYMDDVRYAETEDEGGNTASVLGHLAAIRHAFSARGWAFSQSLHAIRTNPYLYGHRLPLATMVSRHVLASNNQNEGQNPFVDRYVIDYPIGYLRGGDALDFWYRLEAWHGTRLKLALNAALLAKGEIGLRSPYEGYYSGSQRSPSGIAEREVRLKLTGSNQLPGEISFHWGLGWQQLWGQAHIEGEERGRGQVTAGISWTIL